MLSSLIAIDGFIMIPANCGPFNEGDSVAFQASMAPGHHQPPEAQWNALFHEIHPVGGGQSRRFGEPKALILKGNNPLVVDRYRMLQDRPQSDDLGRSNRTRSSSLTGEAEIIEDSQQGPAAAISQLPHQGLHLVMAVDMPHLDGRDLWSFLTFAEGPAILGTEPATLPCILQLTLGFAGRQQSTSPTNCSKPSLTFSLRTSQRPV